MLNKELPPPPQKKIINHTKNTKPNKIKKP